MAAGDVEPCRFCGVEMLWVKMPSGKFNPVDVSTREDGAGVSPARGSDERRVFVVDGVEGRTIRKSSNPSEYAALPTYRSHFATCLQMPSRVSS